MNEQFTIDINQVISDVLRDSNYSSSLFTDLEIQSLSNHIFSQKEEYTNIGIQTTSNLLSEGGAEVYLV